MKSFELKGNLTDSTVWNTGETGNIYVSFFVIFASKFDENVQKCDKADSDQRLECEALKGWSKYLC